ncbi:MAG TPA: hypothetical protein VG694_01345 [Candidatus Paceibacterota bacterium]|nr:hypothetical protein [Candidatus Paceibacterota bacterium]
MKQLDEKIKKFIGSKALTRVIYGLGILVVAALIFHAGSVVGFRKASFGHAWEEHYEENFGMMAGVNPVNGPAGFGMMSDFPNAHGAAGKIIKVEPSDLIVEDRDGTEKVILFDDDTDLRKGRNSISTADLKIDDFAVVIGSPNDQGQIEAKMIRVMPAPGGSSN